ncbi:hypothetical protein R3P38DRAFT_2770059 [Favolaschia claudopus]|uniref:Uncharacterized protein n=1 Tax=Favolaschia claudopus TaxID=2862362 RepID=A0AAW0CM98_9AGAR
MFTYDVHAFPLTLTTIYMFLAKKSGRGETKSRLNSVKNGYRSREIKIPDATVAHGPPIHSHSLTVVRQCTLQLLLLSLSRSPELQSYAYIPACIPSGDVWLETDGENNLYEDALVEAYLSAASFSSRERRAETIHPIGFNAWDRGQPANENAGYSRRCSKYISDYRLLDLTCSCSIPHGVGVNWDHHSATPKPIYSTMTTKKEKRTVLQGLPLRTMNPIEPDSTGLLIFWRRSDGQGRAMMNVCSFHAGIRVTVSLSLCGICPAEAFHPIDERGNVANLPHIALELTYWSFTRSSTNSNTSGVP